MRIRPAVKRQLLPGRIRPYEEAVGSIVRIWDLPPSMLCRQHLLGEHRELHALWNILTGDRRGYARHPETQRWRGKLAALYRRHEALTAEMRHRRYRHASPLDQQLATGSAVQDVYIDTPDEQRSILRSKGCGCSLSTQDVAPEIA